MTALCWIAYLLALLGIATALRGGAEADHHADRWLADAETALNKEHQP